MSIDLRCKYDRSLRARCRAVRVGPWAQGRRRGPGHPGEGREKMATDVPGRGEGRAAAYGQDARDTGSRPRSPPPGRRSKAGLRSPRRCAASGFPARARSTSGATFTEGASPRGSGPSRGTGRERSDAKGAPMTREQEFEAQVVYLKKRWPRRRRGASESGQGPGGRRAFRAEAHDLADLLEAAGLARSTYCYVLAHPKEPTRPEPRG